MPYFRFRKFKRSTAVLTCGRLYYKNLFLSVAVEVRYKSRVCKETNTSSGNPQLKKGSKAKRNACLIGQGLRKGQRQKFNREICVDFSGTAVCLEMRSA